MTVSVLFITWTKTAWGKWKLAHTHRHRHRHRHTHTHTQKALSWWVRHIITHQHNRHHHGNCLNSDQLHFTPVDKAFWKAETSQKSVKYHKHSALLNETNSCLTCNIVFLFCFYWQTTNTPQPSKTCTKRDSKQRCNMGPMVKMQYKNTQKEPTHS